MEPDVVDEFFAMLDARGVPRGVWLVDIMSGRKDLHRVRRRLADLADEIEDAVSEAQRVMGSVDLLLERLQQAVVRAQPEEPG